MEACSSLIRGCQHCLKAKVLEVGPQARLGKHPELLCDCNAAVCEARCKPGLSCQLGISRTCSAGGANIALAHARLHAVPRSSGQNDHQTQRLAGCQEPHVPGWQSSHSLRHEASHFCFGVVMRHAQTAKCPSPRHGSRSAEPSSWTFPGAGSGFKHALHMC